jgi:hypothetical protein
MKRPAYLGFEDRIAIRPRSTAWIERLFATAGFLAGVTQWNNPGCLEIFEREHPTAHSRINRIATS